MTKVGTASDVPGSSQRCRTSSRLALRSSSAALHRDGHRSTKSLLTVEDYSIAVQEKQLTENVDNKAKASPPAHDCDAAPPSHMSPAAVQARSVSADLPQTSLHRTNVLPWRGHRWLVRSAKASTVPTTLTSATMVRFQSTLLSMDAHCQQQQNEMDWTLGVVVHSYIRNDNRQLMHIVVLDNGRELHLPSGSVESIKILEQFQQTEDIDDAVQPSVLELSGGHASSVNKLPGSASSHGTF